MKTVVVATLFAALAAPASGEQGRASLAVTVTVPARVTLDIVDVPATVEFTAQDVARGYKDVAARYTVHHNDRNGFLLQISAQPGVARWIEVHGLDDDVVLRDDAVAVRRAGSAFVQELALRYRFVLDPSAPTGRIALPVHLAATPL